MMNERKQRINWYCLINIIVLLAVAIIFLVNYRPDHIFKNISIGQIVITIFSVLIVHLVKAGRLYFAMYGHGISIPLYLKTYCKVTPVGVILPFKLGEIFRVYCYGRIIKSYTRGIVIIVLDRFMDTAALLTVMIIMLVMNSGDISLLIAFMLIFLMSSMLVYLAFPSIYKYWKEYLLEADASPRKLAMLRTIEYFKRIYVEIEKVIKGRGMILFFLSFIAWITEIGGVMLLNYLYGNLASDKKLMKYLESALNGKWIDELKQFVLISVVLLIALYLLVKTYESLSRKRIIK